MMNASGDPQYNRFVGGGPQQQQQPYQPIKINDEPDIVLEYTGWTHVPIPDTQQQLTAAGVNPNAVMRYAVTGHESQVVTLQMPPDDRCQSEPGAMMYLTNNIEQSVACAGCLERACSGESCFAVHYTNRAQDGSIGVVGLTGPFPTSKVVPVNLASPDVGGSLVAQQGSFLASYGNVEVGISLDCNLLRCCCGGLGLVRQKLHGDGTVFLASTGTMVQKVLAPGETIIIDTNCIMAFAGTCKLDLRRAGGIMGMLGGGEGIFNTTLTGPGLVIVQSMNETIFRQALVAHKIYRR